MFHDGESLVVLYQAKELYEAQELHDVLEAEGIASRIEGEFLKTALGELPLGITTGPRVVVREEDEPQAKVLLEQFLQLGNTAASASDTTNEDQLCLSCGTLMGDAETCPQCGWSYQVTEGGPPQ